MAQKTRARRARRKASRVGRMARGQRGRGARHPSDIKSGKATTPVKRAKHVPKERTPEEFAKLSPAQRLYVQKGIVPSSLEGARKLERHFEKKELRQEAGKRFEQTRSLMPEEIKPAEEERGMEGMPEFDPAEKAAALRGNAPRLAKAVFGITIAAGIIMAATAAGSAIIASGGLSLPLISRTAAGASPKLSKFGRIIQEPSGRTVEYLSYRQLLKAPINSVNARRFTKWLGGLVAGKKFALVTIGLITQTTGAYIIGKWGEHEGLDTLVWEEEKAEKAGEYEQADKIGEVLDEALDVPMWESIISVMPILGIGITAKRIQLAIDAARLKRENTALLRDRRETGRLTPDEQKWEDIYTRQGERDEFFSELRGQAGEDWAR